MNECRALNSKCCDDFIESTSFAGKWMKGWNIVKFHPMIFKLQDFRSKPTAASNPPPPRTPNEPNLEPATWLIRLLSPSKKWGHSLFVSGKKQIKLDQKFIKCFKMKHYPIQLIQSIYPELRLRFLQGQLWFQKDKLVARFPATKALLPTLWGFKINICFK